tara:strand:- start:294 stop:614 length:321 start_codon:yes stop_codon:yes gene_type:complete
MSELSALQVDVKDIDRNAIKMKNLLMRDYAMSKARFTIGDILQGSVFTILVTNIKWGPTRGYSDEINPYAAYCGKILTKKLLPRKDGDTAMLNDYDDLIKLENKGG